MNLKDTRAEVALSDLRANGKDQRTELLYCGVKSCSRERELEESLLVLQDMMNTRRSIIREPTLRRTGRIIEAG